MFSRLRSATALVLALAFVAGPASAACAHAAGHGPEPAPAGHEMPMEDAPCHDVPPAPEPADAGDCDAPCCTSDVASEAPATLTPTADVAVAPRVLVGEVWTPPVPVATVEDQRSPPLRRHAELQRFLI